MTTLDILEEFLRELKYGQIKPRPDEWIAPNRPGQFVKTDDSIRVKTFNNHCVTLRVYKNEEVTFIRRRRKGTDVPINIKLCNPGSLIKIKRLLNF